MKRAKFYLVVLTGFLMGTVFQTMAQEFYFKDAWGKDGFTLLDQKAASVSVNFSVTEFGLTDNEINGEVMKNIRMSGAFLPNDAGAPDLPGFSRYLAIPEGATVELRVSDFRREVYEQVAMAPAPQLPKDNEDGPLNYSFNERIYSKDAFYPEEPFKVSPVTEIRGVDVVLLGITPFQYNPVTQELVVYRDVQVEIQISGGSGTYGEDRLRSRWFDPVLQDALLNYGALPEIDYHKRIANNTDNTGYEYLIVVPNDPAWMPFAEQIKDFRTKQGISTGIVTLNDIGGTSASALENYFNNAYNSWNPAPVAVLLMADYGTNASNRIISPIYNNYCASDNIFADVNNNSMPDMIFARMTAQNTTHLQTMVSKMIGYESNPPSDAGFYNNPITALGWQTERWFQICSESVGGFWREAQGKDPVRINAIYEGTPGSIWSTAPNTSTVVSYFGPSGQGYIPAAPSQLGGWSGGTASQVINAINDGAFALQHRDHGATTGWGEPAFNNNHINSLSNTEDNELVFVFSINCLTGKYNISGECFTEKFHRHTYNGENAGALGLIAASEVSYSFVNDTYVWGMIDNMEPDFLPDYGMPVEERGFLPAFGNAAGKYFLQQSAWPYNTGNKQVTYNLFHHHGGAFLTVYTEVPQNLSVTHDPVLFSGETTFSVIANEGSLIALTNDDEIIGLAEGTGAPVNITIEPQLPPAEILVTVTKQNYYRYESTVEVIPPSGPYVVFDEYEINDPADNYNNGQLDFGESVFLHMTLKNVGSELASGIEAVLATSDPYITIIDGTADFGDIPAGGSATIQNAFAVEAANDLPDGHQINFTVTANDGTTDWTSYFSVTGHAALLEVEGFAVDDASGNNNGILDPGETAPVIVSLKNNGGSSAQNIMAAMSTSDPYLTIHTSAAQSFGDLDSGQTATGIFSVEASASIPGGYLAEALLNITADQGIEQQDVIEFNFADYCYPSANCSWGDGFTGFSLEQISNMNNGCSSGGYGDFTSMVADLEAGQTYTVSWKTGYNDQDACLWIDLNNNREFEDSERLITDYNLGSAGTVYSTDFALPENIYPGNKRLRIRGNWQNSSADPCSNFTYGETEDYTVNISGGVVVADFTAEPTYICNGGEVNFTDQSTGPVTAWEWEFPGGNPATSAQQNPVVTYPDPGTYDVQLTVTGQSGSDTKLRSSYIEAVPGPGQPMPPSGMTQLCENPGNTLYSTTGAVNSTDYVWTLEPAIAGNLVSSGAMATVNWANDYTGQAEIFVQGMNDCGAGPVSEPLGISIAPLPGDAGSITGEATGCVGEQSVYTVGSVSNANGYEWVLEPAVSGAIEVNNEICTVTWDLYYEGTATIKVRGVNNCGSGEWSETMEVEVQLCNTGGLPPGWDYNTTQEQHTILIPNSANLSVFGNGFLQGDYIGVFYLDDNGEEKCGGAIEWTLADNTSIMAFGDDFTTPEKDGFASGEEIRWRVFCWNVEEEYSLMPEYDPAMPQTNGTYLSFGISGVLSLEAYITAGVELSEGWSGFSLPVTPFEQDLDVLFEGVMEDMVVLRNSSQIFWPAMNINTFNGWEADYAAALKMESTGVLTIPGIPDTDQEIEIQQGWNYLPVITNCNIAVSDLAATVPEDIEMIKEIAGYRIYWPAQGIATLEVLEVGKAYLIRLANDLTLSFPPCTDAQPTSLGYNVPAIWNQPHATPGSHIISIDHRNVEGLQPGDYVGVFTQNGICAGCIEVGSPPVALSVFADDDLTPAVEGFNPGDKFVFRMLDGQSMNEVGLNLVFSEKLPDHDTYFSPNGISAVKSGYAGTNMVSNPEAGISIFPNPAKEKVFVSGLQGNVSITINTLQGRTVAAIERQGESTLEINLGHLLPGVYLMKINSLNNSHIIKLIHK